MKYSRETKIRKKDFINNTKICEHFSIFRCIFLFLLKQPPEVFYTKRVLKNYEKFTGKHLCQSLFFNKGLRPATLLKKRH